MTSFFDISSKAEKRNFAPLLHKKQFNLQSINNLHKYFLRLCSNTDDNIREAIQKMKEVAEEERVNPWFKKAATILSVNSRINMQKSFWRMKMNMNTAGVTFNATMIVKLKKMYNNIKKFYIVNMYKSFLMIGKHGRSGHDPSFSQSYSGIRESIPPVIDDSVIHDGEQSAKYTAMVQNSNSTALSIMNRLFKRNLTKQVRKWHFGVFPERKIELLNTEYNTRSKDDYKYLAKLGAIECFSKTHQQMAYKAKVKAFRLITQNMYNKRSDDAHDEGLTEKLDLLNRQKALMEEIKQYKEENDGLVYEI